MCKSRSDNERNIIIIYYKMGDYPAGRLYVNSRAVGKIYELEHYNLGNNCIALESCKSCGFLRRGSEREPDDADIKHNLKIVGIKLNAGLSEKDNSSKVMCTASKR